MQSFETLSKQFAERFDTRHFPEQPASLYEPNEYFLKLGGKRIRPVLEGRSFHPAKRCESRGGPSRYRARAKVYQNKEDADLRITRGFIHTKQSTLSDLALALGSAL